MAKHILKLFHRPVATPVIFLHQTLWQFSDGDTLTGASNAEAGIKKIVIFERISRFILEMIQDRAIVTMEGE